MRAHDAVLVIKSDPERTAMSIPRTTILVADAALLSGLAYLISRPGRLSPDA
jgi:hypothetical protein